MKTEYKPIFIQDLKALKSTPSFQSIRCCIRVKGAVRVSGIHIDQAQATVAAGEATIREARNDWSI